MKRQKYFCVISIHRADLEELGYDSSGLSDARMHEIADAMGELHLESGAFWRQLRAVAEHFRLPRLRKSRADSASEGIPGGKVVHLRNLDAERQVVLKRLGEIKVG